MNCPGSVALGRLFPPSESSEYAEEGTAAHRLAEIELKRFTGEFTPRGRARALHELEKGPYYNKAMQDYVNEYVDTVKEAFNAADVVIPGRAEIFVEVMLDLDRFAPGSFGTSDAVVVGPGTLHVFDLKYGQGIRRDADHDEQLMLYALGAFYEFCKHEKGYAWPSKVGMTIVQPRLQNTTTFETSMDELLKWGNKVKKDAGRAHRGERYFKPGEWCQFCPAAKICTARAAHAHGLINSQPSDPMLLTPEQIASLWPDIEAAGSWVRTVKNYALNAAQSGMKFPGMKLVEGQSRRKIKDPSGLIDSILFEEGYDVRPKLYDVPQLKSITALEKLIGRGLFAKCSYGFVEKDPGRPTLVPDKDKRAPLLTASDMFEDEGE
jgi:hypothetical protein